MTTISKLLILLVSIGTSGVSCYATYNSLFSRSPQVTDQAFNDEIFINKNDGFDLSNVHADKYLQIDSTLSVQDQQDVMGNNYNLLTSEIDNLIKKIYDLEANRKQIKDLKKLDRELQYKLAVRKKLTPKITQFRES